jgi:drug/metabolite transporter (DMT)-like permease
MKSILKTKPAILGVGEILAIIAVICISLGVVFQRAASGNVDMIAGSFINILPVFVGGLFYLRISSRKNGTTFGRPTRLAVAAGIGGAIATNVIGLPIFLRALSLGGAVIVTPIVASAVIWAGIFARIMIGQRLSKHILLGLAIFTVGLILLFVGQISTAVLSSHWYFAIPLALIVAILYGFTMSLTAFSLKSGLSQSGSVAISGIVSLAGLGLLVVIERQPIQIFNMDALILFLAGVFQIAGLIASTAAFARTSVVCVGSILVTHIIWTSIVAWAFLGDMLNIPMAAALAIALLGLIIVQYSESKRS